ncbi:MAG: carbohydrate binding domain-containing protein, partial [Oscillospiraceae bacterium]|nr:carbohydrate binding domain-containing protein [Oscillospiraceae bacterium]
MKKMHISKLLACVTAAASAAAVLSGMPAITASAAKLLGAEFETSNDSFTGRGGASVQWTSDQAYQVNCSLFVSERTHEWCGAMRSADSLMKPGGTYKISAAVYQASGAPVVMKLSLEYKLGDETKYEDIAKGSAESEQWLVLSEDAFKVPEGATNLSIYAETAEAKDAASYIDFYLDSVEIHGAPSTIKKGDVNGDLSVNNDDVFDLVKALTTESDEFEAGADLNEDGIVNSADLTLLKNMILFPPPKPQTEIVGDWDNYQETASGQMLNAYKGSLLRMGNTSRIREKIAKAQRGEQVTIGYIGGSITQDGSATSHDKCISSLTCNYFKDTFGTGNNVTYVNAGKAGTSSVVGNMRVENDIFAKNCDVIFIEFAVNDQGDARFQKSYEALVKKCLTQENEPAVILITLCQKSLGTNEEWMAKIGEKYDLAVISGKGAIQGGSLNWDQQYGSGDTIHPGNGGHQIIADCIGYYYRQALRSENETEEYVVPDTKVDLEKSHLVAFDQLENFNAGSWTWSQRDNAYTASGNQPMTFTINGKGVLLLFQSNSNSEMGSVNVSAGGKTNKVNSNLQWTWGGQDGDIGYYQDSSGQLNISISSAGGKFV